MKSHALLLTLAFGLASETFAHGMWIEPSKPGLALRYGEYSHGLREGKDKLETFGAVEARDAEGDTLPVTLAATGFQVPTVGALTAVVRNAPTWGEGPEATKPQAYLRYLPSWRKAAPPAAFPLDIVPVGDGTPAFTAYKEGKPYSGAWIEVTAPNGWSKWFEADSLGKVRIQAPWPGLYVLAVDHEEPAQGTHLGKPYAKIRHAFTLSVRKP